MPPAGALPPDIPLFVARSGRDPGEGVETFLLLHGYAGSSFSWRHWAPRLAVRGHVVAVDLKGFGSAPKPDDGRYAPDHQAELVVRLIEEQDLRRITLIGHSLGGGIALLVALRLRDEDPDRLRRLVLVSSVAYAQARPPFARLADYPTASALGFRALGARRVVRGVLRSIVHDRARVDVDQIRGYAEPLESREAVHSLIASARQVVPAGLDRLITRYPELDVPTLLVWGRQDRVVPLWVGERLERDLPDARLRVLEACGHLPAEELPDESWALVETFLDEVPPPVVSAH